MLHNTDLELNNIYFQIQKQLATLDNIQVLLKSVLIDLCAHNFVHAKTYLRSRCMHACHRANNLSSTASYHAFQIMVKLAEIYWDFH